MEHPSPRSTAGPGNPLSLAILLAAFVIGASPALAAPEVRLIPASETDPAIDDVIGVHHVALDTPEGRLGRLLLFYPGTTATAQMYSELIERGAALGYHAIGLAYVNDIAVNVLCAGMGGTDCHERVRREVLLGIDESDLIEVDADNGAFHRLDRLLAYLEAIAPEEGWEQFRDEVGDVRWELVTVSGHSQGAGHAAFTARLHGVARAVLFSGTEPALWTLADDFATPDEDFFGFAHRLEPIYDPIQRSWDNIGIPGEPSGVDDTLPPFGGTQQLYTTTQECTGDPGSNGFFHNCHCVNDWMPHLLDGTPTFQYVWDHLFTLAAATQPVPLAPALGPVLLGSILLLNSAFARRRRRGGSAPSTPMQLARRHWGR